MGHLGEEVQGSKLPKHSLKLGDTCSRGASPRCPWILGPRWGDTARGGQSRFNAILAFSTGLENSPTEQTEDLRRVSPILGLEKKATYREDAVEPKHFFLNF